MSALADIINSMMRYYTKKAVYHMAGEERRRLEEKEKRNKPKEYTEEEVAAAKAIRQKHFDNLACRANNCSATTKNKNDKQNKNCNYLIEDDGNAGYSVNDGHLTYDDHGEDD